MTSLKSADQLSSRRGLVPHSAISAVSALSLLIALSACEERIVSVPIYPPSADLALEAKPVPTDDIVTSAQAAAEYDAAVEAWGERGWRQVGRLCRYFKGHGMAVECPEP